MSKVIPFYKKVLDAAGLTVDHEDFVCLPGREEKNIILDGRTVALPTPSILKNTTEEKVMIFNPGREVVGAKVSPAVNKLRYNFNVRLNIAFSVLGAKLLQIASSPDMQHSKLNPDQSEVIGMLGTVSSDSAVKFTEIMMSEGKDSVDSFFVNLYVKRGGVVKGKTYHGAGIVNFEFYSKLLAGETKFGSINLTQKDIDCFIKLYKTIFYTIEDIESYNVGHNSAHAPYFETLMRTLVSVAQPINQRLELFSSVFDNPTELDKTYISLKFVDQLHAFSEMDKELILIPNQGIVELSQPAPQQPNYPVPGSPYTLQDRQQPIAATPTLTSNGLTDPEEALRRLAGIGQIQHQGMVAAQNNANPWAVQSAPAIGIVPYQPPAPQYGYGNNAGFRV